MTFVPKEWVNRNQGRTTPLDAVGLIDLETRLAAYTDSLISLNDAEDEQTPIWDEDMGSLIWADPVFIPATKHASLQAAVDFAATKGCPDVMLALGTTNIDELVLPGVSSTASVGLRGQGQIVTKLKQTVDRGAGTYAVKADTTHGPTQCTLRDLRVIGPNETFAYGVKPCLMDGIRLTPRMNLDNCAAVYFSSGVHMFGDHISLDHCVVALNYYNVKLGGSVTTGDLHLDTCDISAAAFSSIGIVTGPQVVAGFQMYGGHIGFAPYGVYVEAGVSSAGNPVALAMMFDRTSFEAFGNGVFYDEDAAGYFGQISIRDAGPMNLSAIPYIAARGRPALYRLGGMRKWRWHNSNCSGGGPLADCMFSITNATSGFQDCVFDGVLEDMFRQYWLGPKPLFVSTSGAQRSYVKGTYEGQILRAIAAVSKGRVCEWAQAQTRHANVSGANKSDLVGVAYNDAAIGECVVALTKGSEVPGWCTENFAADEKVCLDPADASKIARAITHPAETVIGCSWAGGFASAPGLATLALDVPTHRV